MVSCDHVGAKPIPSSRDECFLSSEEYSSVQETGRHIIDKSIIRRTHDLDGCALMEISVRSDGVVQAAKIVRRNGGGEAIWSFIARKLTFIPRSQAWSGLIFVDMRHPKGAE